MINTNKTLKKAGKDVFRYLEDLDDIEEFIQHITCSHIETSKKILREKYINGKTNKEIAQELNMARQTYYDSLSNAHMLAGLLCSKIGSVREFRTVKQLN